MSIKLRVFLCATFLSLAMGTAAVAQQTMDNAAVVKLQAAGLSEDLIVQTINGSAGHYDTSTDAMIALKKKGITDKEIGAMLSKNANPNGPAPVAAAATGDPDDPQSPHNGIFMEVKGPDGKIHLQRVLKTSTSGTKGPSLGSSLGTAYSFGLHKSKVKFVIPGTKAELETSNATPIFWIYTGDMSIENLQLMPLELKKDSREATGASYGLLGFSSGSASNAHEGLATEKMKDGVYKVNVPKPLTPGPYAFVQGAGGLYYDFDILATP